MAITEFNPIITPQEGTQPSEAGKLARAHAEGLGSGAGERAAAMSPAAFSPLCQWWPQL